MSQSTPRAPRLSGLPTGLPTPSRASGVPTPSRRSLGGALHAHAHSSASSEAESSRALAEAMRHNPPSTYRSPTVSSGGSSSPAPGGSALSRTPSVAARRPVAGAMAPPLPRTPGHPSILRSANASSSNTAAYPSTPTARGAAARRSSLAPSTAGRPESRHEDRPKPSSSLSQSSLPPSPHNFQLGDRVRIASQGTEGALRFIGEIDGKKGTWAGIELSGSFTGRGKNDGSVDGKTYFSCPPLCGVFAIYARLEPATVGGPGSVPRPASVASSRSSVRESGRATPSISGRSATPSLTGRATPSISGRSTPSHGGMPPPSRQTPLATSTRQPRVAAAKTSAEASAAAQANITVGSRASRYVGMTAKQLSARSTLDSSTTSTIGSLSRSTSTLAKSTNGLNKSTSATPRAPRLSGAVGIGQPTPTRAGPRMSMSNLATPARSGRTSAAGNRRPAGPVPEMPPPPSPTKSIKSSGYGRPASRQSDAFSSRPASRASESRPPTPLEASFSALDASGSALQDRISSLMASTSSSSPATNRLSLLNGPSLLTEEDLKVTSPHQQGRIDQLLQRIDALEKENLSLVLDQGKTPEVKTSIPLPDEGDAVRGVAPDPAVAAAESRAVNAERQVQAHATRLTILESELSAASSTSRNLQASIQALERAAAAAGEDRARAEAEAKQVARDAAAKLEEADALVASLKQAVEAQTKGDSDHSAEVQAKAKEIEILQGKVARLGGDLDRERGELREEIEGLKRAGQDTIALYEERLNAAEAMRLDMESLVRARDEELNRSIRTDRSDVPPSPPRLLRQPSTAAEIDNENLTEQVAHLNKRIVDFEDQIEDLQAQAERDEETFRAKLDKARAAERELHGELVAMRAERDEAGQAEAAAKQRVEEIEVALASNKSTLEGARAEIESLRAEVANLENLQGASQGDDRAREVEKHAEHERSLLKVEIGRLQALVDDSQTAKCETAASVSSSAAEATQLRAELAELKSDFKTALDDNDDLLQQVEDLKAKAADTDGLEALHDQQTKNIELRDKVRDLQKELEAARAAASAGGAAAGVDRDSSDLGRRVEASEEENRLLLAEVEDLREAVRSLEELMEDKILAEESKLDGVAASDERSSAETEKLRNALAEAQAQIESQALKYQSDFDHLQQKVGDIDRQNQQEVQELESLIESKIYREDELEREIETLRYELARASSASRAESSSSSHRRRESDDSAPALGSFAAKTASLQDTCELCDEPGHEIEYCPLFSGSLGQTSTTEGRSPLAHKSSDSGRSAGGADEGPWCEDCEAYGHATEDCEYAQEVF